MNPWYARVANSRETSDLAANVLEMIRHYEREYEAARAELVTQGQRIIHLSQRLPGLLAFRFGQLQEIDAVLHHIEQRLDRAKAHAHRNLMERSDRALSSRDAERYAAAEEDVYHVAEICNQVALLRNMFIGIHNGLNCLQYQVSNVVKLREAGLEDATL